MVDGEDRTFQCEQPDSAGKILPEGALMGFVRLAILSDMKPDEAFTAVSQFAVEHPDALGITVQGGVEGAAEVGRMAKAMVRRGIGE